MPRIAKGNWIASLQGGCDVKGWEGKSEYVSKAVDILGTEAGQKEERQMLENIYGDSLNYDKLNLHQNSLTHSLGLPGHAVGNDIYIPDKSADVLQFGPFGGLTEEGQLTLIHEAGHAWQNQNGPNDYMYKAAWANIYAQLRYGDRDKAYNWKRRSRTFHFLNSTRNSKRR